MQDDTQIILDLLLELAPLLDAADKVRTLRDRVLARGRELLAEADGDQGARPSLAPKLRTMRASLAKLAKGMRRRRQEREAARGS